MCGMPGGVCVSDPSVSVDDRIRTCEDALPHPVHVHVSVVQLLLVGPAADVRLAHGLGEGRHLLRVERLADLVGTQVDAVRHEQRGGQPPAVRGMGSCGVVSAAAPLWSREVRTSMGLLGCGDASANAYVWGSGLPCGATAHRGVGGSREHG